MTRVLFALLRGAASPSALPPADWSRLLEFSDRTQLTLYLRAASGLPPQIEHQIEERFLRNAERRLRIGKTLREIQQGLADRHIPFVFLKGFTHELGFGLPAGCRVQYDVDLLVQRQDTAGAAAVLESLGYRPHGRASLSDEHGRPWVRPFQWQWRGDYFDPDMPVAIELHDTVWSPSRDHIACAGAEKFWDRRGVMEVQGLSLPAFAEVDRVAFAALHALRHILRNDARLAHVWELAKLLETRAEDHALWLEWRTRHDAKLRLLQMIAFRFAQEWFAVPLPTALAEECEAVPGPIASWLREFAWSPVDNLTRPNKDVLWLHLALVSRWRERVGVLSQRLLPPRLPHGEEAAVYTDRLRRRLYYHAAAFFPALTRGARWWWRRRKLMWSRP